MKLQNMFKKNRKSYIPLKSERPEVPEGLLKKCNKCGAAILTEEVKSAGYICPKCQGYFRVHAYERIRMTVDEDSFEEWEKGKKSEGKNRTFRSCCDRKSIYRGQSGGDRGV